MAKGNPNIGKVGKKFTKNDPRINRKGQPVKKFSQHIADIEAKGYVAPTRDEYFRMVGLLVAMQETDLTEFANDQERPYWIRIVAKDLTNVIVRTNMMKDYRDWLYGKAAQSTDITSGGKEIKMPTTIVFKDFDGDSD